MPSSLGLNQCFTQNRAREFFNVSVGERTQAQCSRMPAEMIRRFRRTTFSGEQSRIEAPSVSAERPRELRPRGPELAYAGRGSGLARAELDPSRRVVARL